MSFVWTSFVPTKIAGNVYLSEICGYLPLPLPRKKVKGKVDRKVKGKVPNREVIFKLSRQTIKVRTSLTLRLSFVSLLV